MALSDHARVRGRSAAAGATPRVLGPAWLPPFALESHGQVASDWEGRPVEYWRERWGLPCLCIFRETRSTNNVARALADAAAPAGTVVLAEVQSAGRGRAGRSWLAPAGSSLLLSMILRPEGPGPGTAATPLVIGLAVARALERVTGISAGIKWPNDVLLENRKVAGILCEAAAGGPAGEHLVAGIGINVRQTLADFPPELAPLATSLALATGRNLDRPVVADHLVQHLLPLARSSAGPLDDATLEGLARRDVLFGRIIEVDGQIAGTACGIAPDGALMVRTAGGGATQLRSGTVRTVAR